MASQRATSTINRPMHHQMAMNRNRGRPQHIVTKPMPMIDNNMRAMSPAQIRPQIQGGVVLPNNMPMPNAGQFIQVRLNIQSKYTYI